MSSTLSHLDVAAHTLAPLVISLVERNASVSVVIMRLREL